MRRLLFILLFLASFEQCYSFCLPKMITAWPETKSISENSLFLITGYSLSQDIVKSLNEKYPIYLKQGSKKIRLKLEGTYIGEYNVTQTILRPEEKLEFGKEYTVHIDNIPNSEPQLGTWNENKKKYDPLVYKVKMHADTVAPAWIKSPIELEKSFIYFGCGPDIHVSYGAEIKDESEFLIRATVTNLTTSTTTTFFLDLYENTISVGHGMCSGGFDLEKGKEFEVSFDLFDSSGNITKWAGEKIRFTPPEPKKY
jgi:hypothetical protein